VEGDDVRLVGGAVADPTDATDSDTDSPASRAARISRDEQPKPVVAVARRARRRFVVGLIVLIVLLGVLVGGYLWTQTQYFVGREGSEVAVFRGVNTEFGPIRLYSVIENTALRVDDLMPAARSQVTSGITASDRAEADVIVARLAEKKLPPCPVQAAPAPTPTASKSTASKPSTSKSPTKASPGKTTPSVSHSPTPVPSTSQTPTAGVDCRGPQ
jgi:hypothetical protein